MVGLCEEHAGEPYARRCDACAALAGSKVRLPPVVPDEAIEWPRVSAPPNPWSGADS